MGRVLRCTNRHSRDSIAKWNNTVSYSNISNFDAQFQLYIYLDLLGLRLPHAFWLLPSLFSLLLCSYNSDHECKRIYPGFFEIERVVFRIVGTNIMWLSSSPFLTRLISTLLAVYYIGSIPLKECIKRQAFTGYNIAAVILLQHESPFTGIRNSAPLNIGIT